MKAKFSRWLVVVLFAVAMAWVESAVVFYLRTLINRIEPYQPNPLPEFGGLARAELIRELATIIMLFTVGWLAGKRPRTRLGYFLVAFGVWDIFYYVFLKVLTGWPHSLLDWDILFLIPLPWWGPVLAPVCIAVLMIVWGTFVTQWECSGVAARTNWLAWVASAAGAGLALYAFMADAISRSHLGIDALRNALPTHFHWPLFLFALLLMAGPVVDLGRQFRLRRSAIRPRMNPSEP